MILIKIAQIIIFLFSILLAFVPSDATGSNGLVVSSNEIASKVGIDILKRGGNAIDAAVAVGFALSVTHPSAGNLGGGGFMVIRLSDGTVTSIDFREKAPKLSSRDMFLDNFGNVVPGLSWSSSLSSGVPGTVAGYGYVHEKYGLLNWEDIINPSIILAKYGYPLNYFNCNLLNSKKYKEKLLSDDESKKIFTKDSLFKIGDIFIQDDLSYTLNRIAKYGYNEFYFGETSKRILSCMQRVNGIISKDDLSNYQPIERIPITTNYRGYNIYSMPLPSSGGITIANILNQIENIDMNSLNFHSAKHVHFMVEAEKRAYADRALFLGDNDFVDVPINHLISKKYAEDRFNSISSIFSTNSNDIYKGINTYNNESNETTHYSVVDKYGNAVSVTTTLNGWYGNGIVVDGAGFLMNNEMDDFSIKPGHPNTYGLVGTEANSIKPEKRMLSSMTPTIVENLNDELYLVLGSPGGSTIITTIAQIIVNVIDFDMSIDTAVESKRFHHQCLPNLIQLEKNSLSNETMNILQRMGHNFKFRGNFGIGEANCIMYENELFYGAADSRRNAKALAY